ncbi:MAG: preprotein translocase subunit SecE [Lachnospiraceae bacterium]|jgi:preprotein translocase subunit SecE|nr:preprotein translocase subunit SecE [Lachnospiraceae bacterium]
MGEVKTDKAKTDKAPKKNFWKGIKSEFKKITWPDRQLMIRQSIAVVCVSVVMGVIIAILDFGLQYGVDFITKL